jgi:hypothetical protein
VQVLGEQAPQSAPADHVSIPVDREAKALRSVALDVAQQPRELGQLSI